ncbi:MAG: response regulator transcription factor [Nitrospiria bacterium]
MLVLRGKTDREIADTLCISYHTVKKHLQNIFRKAAVKNRIELILAFK